ncbi:hypothetical protein C1646_783201 [Rhizophagus diaphanus]|nr:hypothetical protein C1646_783201 [Rhizophagus diaphanus] [Rhizophagus sp. MUCL 43196]
MATTLRHLWENYRKALEEIKELRRENQQLKNQIQQLKNQIANAPVVANTTRTSYYFLRRKQLKFITIEEIMEESLLKRFKESNWMFEDYEEFLSSKIEFKEITKDFYGWVCKEKITKGEILIKEKAYFYEKCEKNENEVIGKIYMKMILKERHKIEFILCLKGQSIKQKIAKNIQIDRNENKWGIWRLSCFLNHMKEENIEREFCKEMIVVKAKKDINKGEFLGYYYLEREFLYKIVRQNNTEKLTKEIVRKIVKKQLRQKGLIDKWQH